MELLQLNIIRNAGRGIPPQVSKVCTKCVYNFYKSTVTVVADSVPTRLRRTETSTFNIRTDCFICGTSNTRKEKLTNVTTGTGASTRERIIAACLERQDDNIHMRMLSYPDLFAYDAKHHRSCYSSYVSPRNVKADRTKAESEKSLNDYDKAFLCLSGEIETTILSKARKLTTLSSLHE